MIRNLIAAIVLSANPLTAQDITPEPHMTMTRMAEIVQVLDSDAALTGNGFRFTISDVPVLIVTDVLANRMRAMVPIASADGLSSEDLKRVMQANFDTALDARYAIANGRLWGVFIHPFKELERDQFISAIAQTVNIARSYGTAYSGGAMQFGGGDSNEIYRDLLRDLLDKGQDI